jgi:hypothetical protein
MVLRYFKELDEAMGNQIVDPSACDSARSGIDPGPDQPARLIKRPRRFVEKDRDMKASIKAGGLWGRKRRLLDTDRSLSLDDGSDEGSVRRRLDEDVSPFAAPLADGRPSACELITGEATPAMLYWHHSGQQLLPR